MASTIKISKNLMTAVKVEAKGSNRSITKQIEHWVKIGQLMEENPDIPYEFIKSIKKAENDVILNKMTSYSFDDE